MVAQWASFVDHGSGDRSFHGLPNTYFSSVVRALSEGRSPAERVLGAELRPVSLSEAIERGLVQERADALRAGPRDERLVFEVDRVTTGSDAASKLRPSDFVISLDGAPLTRISQLSVAERGSGPIVLTVQRGETLRDVTIDPVSAPSEGVSRVLAWAGMLLHDPHPEVAGEHPISGDGVYVAWLWYGSPASRYGFRPTRRIVEVNGVPTPNLETLMSVVASLPDEDPVRLTLRDLDDKLEVATLRLDPHYWPTQELRRSEGRWTRVELR